MARPPFFVFVHDLGQTPLQWEEQVAGLPPGVGAACPWLRGTRPGGQSVPFTIADAAAALITTLDENGADTGTLVGVGLGATVALHAAAQAPDRVDRVVAISAAGQPSAKQLAAQRMALRLMPKRALAGQNIDKDRLLAALKAAGAADTTDALAGLPVPVTLVAGGRDKTGLGVVRELSEHLPDVKLQLIPEGGADLPRTAGPQLADILFGALADGASDRPVAAPHPGADADSSDRSAQGNRDDLEPWDLT